MAWLYLLLLIAILGFVIYVAVKNTTLEVEVTTLKAEVVELKGIKQQTLTLLQVVREWVSRVQDIRMVTDRKIDRAAEKAATLAEAVQQVPARVAEQIKQVASDSEHGETPVVS